MSTIKAVESLILDIPTIRGHVLSMTTMHRQSVVLVTILFDDGSVGTGEGTTIGGMSYCPESPESIQTAIDLYLAPVLIGQNGDAINALIQRMDKAVQENPIAKSAVETALWDGLARRKGCSIAALFGGAVKRHLPIAWTLASGNLEQDIAEGQEMLDRGRHDIFKIKIGKRSVKEDVAHASGIKAALGDRCSVRVDINQAWSLRQAREGLAGLQDGGIDLVEQPISCLDIEGMAQLTARYEIAVMADEVLQGPRKAMQVAAQKGAAVFSIKTAQSGGLSKARDVMAIAASSGIETYGGTMLESGLGTAAALQLFATSDEMAWGTEMFGPLLLQDEILSTPLDFNNFGVTIPNGPGHGVALDHDKVRFFARDTGRDQVSLRATT